MDIAGEPEQEVEQPGRADLDEPGEAINNVLESKELKQDIRLYGSRCESCGTVQFPMAQVCIKCRGRGCLVEHKLGKRGKVFTRKSASTPKMYLI